MPQPRRACCGGRRHRRTIAPCSRRFGSTRKRILGGVVAVAVLAGGGVLAATSARRRARAPPPRPRRPPPPRRRPPPTVPPPVAPLTGLHRRARRPTLNRPAVIVKIDNAPAGPAAVRARRRPTSCSRSASRGTPPGSRRCSTPPTPSRSGRSAPPAPPTWDSCRSSAACSTPPPAATAPSSTSSARPTPSTSGTTPAAGGSAGSAAAPGPHNLYTSLAELYAKSPEQPPAAPAGLPVPGRRRGPRLRRRSRPTGVALSFGAAEISRFVWDPPSKQWHRYHGTARHFDPAGVPIAPVNVVVLALQYEFSQQHGQLPAPRRQHRRGRRAGVHRPARVIHGRWVAAHEGPPARARSTSGHGDRRSPRPDVRGDPARRAAPACC